jgi:hypothetical protein
MAQHGPTHNVAVRKQRSEVLTVKMSIVIFWALTQCGLVCAHQYSSKMLDRIQTIKKIYEPLKHQSNINDP